jgi:diketogulonate reductase-like aldo/keto reductase
MGGARIDCSLTYLDQVGVADGIRASGLSRDQIFITSKVPRSLAI